MAFEYFLYRTDLNNTLVDRSDASFAPLPPNTGEIYADWFIPKTQPLYLYFVVLGDIFPNNQANIDNYLKEINPTQPDDPVTQNEFTGYTATTDSRFNSIEEVSDIALTGVTNLGTGTTIGDVDGRNVSFKSISVLGDLTLSSNVDNIIISGNSGSNDVGILYVSKNGDDLNTGLIKNKPKLTIQSAIDAAVSGDTVQILDGGIYNETINTKDGVNIIGRNASLDLSNESLNLNKGVIELKSIFRTSGSTVMIQANAVSPLATRGYAVLVLDEIKDEGSGVTIQNGLNRPLDLHIKQIYVMNSNIFLNDVHDSTSHTHITADDLYLYSSGCTGFDLSNGGNIVGNIQHIKELGDGIGSSTAFNIVDGEVNIIAPDCRATTVANIETDGVFRFTSQRFSGAVNNNGGQYSYFTAGADNGNMKLSTNLNLELDSNTITIPTATGFTGSVLSIGTGGLINYTTFTEPALEWTDDTANVSTVNTTTETIVYSITPNEDITAGNLSYVLNYTPGYFMLATARLRRNDVNGAILDTRTFNGSGSQTLSYSLPLTTGTTISSGETIVLTIQFSAASPATTVADTGFLTALKTGSAVTSFESIVGNPMDNISLASLFDDKADLSDVSNPRLQDNSEVPSALNDGKLRYRKTSNSSLLECVMQVDVGVYQWVVIKENTW